MRKILIMVLVCFFLVGSVCAVCAAEKRGTTKEGKAMVDKAVSYLKKNGNNVAYAEFTNPKGKFVDRDLYIFVIDMNGKMIAHGANKALIGKNLIGLKDSEGNAFIEKMVDLAQSKGNGWVDYKWTNPVSKKIEAKSSYIQRVGDVFVGCGVYK